MTPAEIEFAKRLDSASHDVTDCITHIYQELAFHHIAGTDPDIRDAVNSHTGFFSAVLSAHQTSGFVALHRLYETDADHESLASLLRCAQLNLGVFTRDALIARKREQGWPPDAARISSEGAFEPDARGFAGLRGLCAEGRTMYQKNARDIRHQMFGHSGTFPFEERVRLFEKLMVRDLEKMAVIAYTVHDQLSDLFTHGLAPSVDLPESNIVHVVRDARNGNLEGKHFQVAREVADFLERFTRMVRRDEQEIA